MPSTTALTWPTVAELEHVARAAVVQEDELFIRISGLKDALDLLVNRDYAPSIVDDAEPLTLETLGALSGCLAKLRFDLEYLLDAVRAMELQRDAMALEVDFVAERNRKEANRNA